MRSDVKICFADEAAFFADQTGGTPGENAPWSPVKIAKEEIDEEIERLASLPAPADGRRASLIVHPSALANAPGLAPGIQVSLSVLKPGEKTDSFRHNATEVNFCIRGSGYTVTAGRRIGFGQYDVWNNPSYTPYWRVNDGNDLQVCLTFSNVPLLQFMQVYLWEANPPLVKAAEEESSGGDDQSRTRPSRSCRRRRCKRPPWPRCFELQAAGSSERPYLQGSC